MAASVSLGASQHVINGAAVNASAATLPMVDSVSGQTGDGIYTISLTSGAAYVVTKGQAPAIGTTQLNLAQAFVVGNSVQEVKSLVRYGVTVAAVNATVMHAADADGSYLAASSVTERTLNAALQALIGGTAYGTSFPGTPHEGEFFFRTDLQLLAVYNGSMWVFLNGVIPIGASLPASGQIGELFYLTAGTVGLYVWVSSSWVAIASGSGSTTISYGTSFPGSPTDGEPFLRTDQQQLYVYDLGTTTWMLCSPSLAAVSNGGVNIATSGGTINLKVAISAGSSDPGSPYTGQLFYRTDLTALRYYNGSAWVSVVTGGGVTSLNSLTGALAIAALSSSSGIAVSTAGSNVDLAVAIGTGSSYPGSPYTGQLFYRTDLTQLSIYNGSAWVAVVVVSGGGVTSLNSLTGGLNIAAGAGVSVVASGSTITISSSALAGGYDAAVLATSGLTHFWKMNEAFSSSPSFADSVGSTALAGSGVYSGGVPLINDGEGSCSFPFTSSYNLSITVPLSVLPGSGNLSFEFLASIVLPKSIGAADATSLLGFDTSGLHFLIYINYPDGTLSFYNGTVFDTHINFAYGITHHVVWTWDGTNANLYVDGFQVLQQAISRPNFAAGGMLGNAGSSSSQSPQSNFSKLAIYNVALSSTVVKNHYSQTRG